MRHTVRTTAGPMVVPSPEHEWTVLLFITEPGIGERLPALAGCTAGLCSARDAARTFARYGALVLGVGAQTPDRLAAFTESHGLGFAMVGDSDLSLGRALGVPETRDAGRPLFARAAVVLDRSGRVRSPVHQVPDPDRHAEVALAALAEAADEGPAGR
ncbi:MULTISPECIES: redoxin domain-containing protein [unclassified Streptomyces]|uniref:redoxin domain-containing protein n=1 Tax=unclassified Streptomyces TaxID=2593676 RepID=UPI0019072B8A|nr:redoxin domain-containing protein [Streptomyces sp. HSG2]